MSKINGHGGFWVIDNGGTLVRIDNAEYECDYESENDDVTDSGSAGVREGLACVKKMNSLMMTVAEDDGFYLTALGLEEGQSANIYLRRGAATQWDYVTNTIVKSVRNTNPQDKARRIAITCEYGKLTRNVSAPAGFA